MSEEKKDVKEAPETRQEAPAPGQAPKGQQPQERALFGMIKYKTDEELDKFLSSLSKRDAIVVLVANARYTIARGCQPEEAEVLSKAMRVLQRPDEPAPETPESAKEGEPDAEPEKQG